MAAAGPSGSKKVASPIPTQTSSTSKGIKVSPVKSARGPELQEIMKAMDLLRQVRVEQVLIHKNAFTSSKLYAGEIGLDLPGAGMRRPEGSAVGEHEILRKNIYYLARKTKDIITLVIQMTQRGLFDLDQKDLIMDHENYLVSGVEFFSLIIKQEPGMFKKVLEIFRMFNNDHIADLLTSSAGQPGAVPVLVTPTQNRKPISQNDRSKSVPIRKVKETKLSDPWVCLFCTYQNPTGTGNICQICFKTQGSPFSLIKSRTVSVGGAAALQNDRDRDSPVDFLSCPVCTLNNPVGTPSCEACGSEMDDGVFPITPVTTGVGGQGLRFNSDDEDDDDE